MKRSSLFKLAVLAAGAVVCTVPAFAGASRADVAPAGADPWVYLDLQKAPPVTRLALSPLDPNLMTAVLGNDNLTPVSASVYESPWAGQEWLRQDALAGVFRDAAYDHDARKMVVGLDMIRLRNADQTTWQFRVHPLHQSTLSTHRVAPAPQAGGEVWVTAQLFGTHRVYRLSHSMFQWTDVTPTMPVWDQPAEVAVSPTQPGRVAVAAIDSASDHARVFVTHDNGGTWSAVGPWTSMSTVSSLRWVGDRLFLGGRARANSRPILFASSDFGATWQSLLSFTDFQPEMDVAGDPASPNRLWAGAGEGVYRSTNGGQTWLSPEAGAPRDILRLEYRPAGGQLWAATRTSGVWLSLDGGATWSERNHRLNALPVVSLAVDPQQPADIAAAINSPVYSRAQVATSQDGGLAWLHNVAPSSLRIGAVRYGPSGALYATLTGFNQFTLFRRVRGGDWQHVGFEWPGGTSIIPGQVNFGASEATLLLNTQTFVSAQGQWRSQVWRSGDGGQSWDTVLDLGTPGGAFAGIERSQGAGGLRLLVLEQNFNSDERSRLWASDDDGLSWFDAIADFGLGFAGQLCTGSGSQVLLHLSNQSVDHGRLYRSEDSGDTWAQTSWAPGFLDGWPFTAMHCPDDAREVFLGNALGRVWMSADGGDSFDLLATSDTWGHVGVNTIALTPAGLYVGHANGVWVNPDFALPVPGPTGLVATRTTSRMRYRVSLEWQGGLARVDVRRNGVIVATLDNTGAWSQTRLATRDAELWQVCDAGTMDCSAVVGEN